jgi:hypothetical protein
VTYKELLSFTEPVFFDMHTMEDVRLVLILLLVAIVAFNLWGGWRFPAIEGVSDEL